MQPFTTVLFDADGVIQFNPNFFAGMTAALQGRARFADLHELERPALVDACDLRELLVGFLSEHGITSSPDEVFRVWHETYTIPGVLQLIDRVREHGAEAYLATNQHRLRGTRMIAEKGYQEHFNGAFYSFQMGLAKPDPAYFRAIVGTLGVDPSATLFIDDVEENVLSASRVGLGVHLFDRDSGAAGLERVLAGYGLL